MSTLDIVAEVLREVAPRALKAREIAQLAGSRLPTASRTPETVVSRDLAIDVRDHGTKSRFLRVDRGAFVLKEALPTAFYSDNDKYASAWTRNLVAAGQIAPGVVDERSIRDLKPADVASYRQFHAFSGIGVWSRALRDAGWPDDVNVWSGSCPCTPFSSAGRKRGFSDEQHLWPEWFRLIAACRPAFVFGEQVSSKDGLAWLDVVRADLENADYSLRVLDTPAACAGAPHARHRLYFVAYARERGCSFLSSPWLHDRRQCWDDAARRCSADGRDASAVPDTAGARPRLPQDARADRGDACTCAETYERRSAGDLELERGRTPDEAGAVSDAERVVRDAGRLGGPHGWPPVESDRHGEADGTGFDVDRAVGMGDPCVPRSGRDPGTLPRTQGASEGERIEARDLADEPVAPGAAYNGEQGFRPGDRIRIGDDLGWGGAVRGYWAEDVEWIYCRPEPGHQDGRWRPAESGTQPLVDGLAPGMGRTRAKRLRGFGNAVVLPLATAFVEAVIDTLADAALAIADEAPEDKCPSALVEEQLSPEESAA